jgi:hypothetical protein
VLDAAQLFLRLVLTVEGQHALRGVLREIADALKVVGDPERRNDFAQVDRHGLAAGNGEDRFFLDFALKIVDRVVGGDDALGERGVALDERINGLGRCRRLGCETRARDRS